MPRSIHSHEMFQVDAFSDRLFAGNPAAVLILDAPLDDVTMQAVAAENNLAETAFVTREGAGWRIRWCTPTHEVAFCGHATLAAAHVLFTAHAAGEQVTFETNRVGRLSVKRAGPGRYAMDLPLLAPEVAGLPAGLGPLFTAPPRAVFRNFENVFVELASAEAVRAFAPDLAPIAALGEQGLVVTTAGGTDHAGVPVDFTSRYFAPGAGIPEDPVTGSIHSTLAPYWAERLGKMQLAAFQASARGGRLDCTVKESRVVVTGAAVTYMRATVWLPG